MNLSDISLIKLQRTLYGVEIALDILGKSAPANLTRLRIAITNELGRRFDRLCEEEGDGPWANDIIYEVFESWRTEDHEYESEEAAEYAYSREEGSDEA